MVKLENFVAESFNRYPELGPFASHVDHITDFLIACSQNGFTSIPELLEAIQYYQQSQEDRFQDGLRVAIAELNGLQAQLAVVQAKEDRQST